MTHPESPATPAVADGKGDGMVVVEPVVNEDCHCLRGGAVCTLTLMRIC